MSKVVRGCMAWLRHISLFEKVILVNSVLLIGEAMAGLWVTSHNLETHHYLIDTTFLVLATLLGLFINGLLLRASFRPLFNLLATIREVSTGKTQARAQTMHSDSEVGELAKAFNGMLDTLEAMQREQTLLIFQAQEDERQRIALELHDETGQNLTALLIHTEILSQKLQASPMSDHSDAIREQLSSGLAGLTDLTQHTLENIRVLSQRLRPSVLDDLGLVAAFRWLAEDSRQHLHLEVELLLDGLKDTGNKSYLPSIYETALFRIAQESLTNVARHAGTQHVSLSLIQRPHDISLCICDDGRGYNPEKVHRGFGIPGMRERALLLGGTFTIQSQPNQGTTVQAVLPLPIQHIEGQTHGN